MIVGVMVRGNKRVFEGLERPREEVWSLMRLTSLNIALVALLWLRCHNVDHLFLTLRLCKVISLRNFARYLFAKDLSLILKAG